MVPADIKAELRNLYCALNELLRHFWACFPTQSKQLEDKVGQLLNPLLHSVLLEERGDSRNTWLNTVSEGTAL